MAMHETIDPITFIFISTIGVGYSPSPVLEPAFPLTYIVYYSKNNLNKIDIAEVSVKFLTPIHIYL